MRSLKEQQGDTLVELLVVIAILAVVGGLAIGFFLSTIGARAKVKHHLEVQENARLALDRILYEVRRAEGIAGTSDFGVNIATVPGDTLDLTMSDGTRSPTTFDVAAGTLRIKQGSGSVTPLTTNDVVVSNLTFTNLSSTNGLSKDIEVTLTVDALAGATGTLGATETVTAAAELHGL